jgi:trimeric autotransporter adhesin
MSTITIGGKTYTVVFGTSGSDNIDLSAMLGNFLILSGNGNDTIVGGLQGDNVIVVGNGNNTILGASLHAGYNTTILAGNGHNIIFTDLDAIHFDVLSAPVAGTPTNPFIIPFVYGNSTVIAGDGGNYITGDGLFEQTQKDTSNVGFTVNVGTITYVSGCGNDTLYGLIDVVDHHVSNVDGLFIDTHFGQVNLYGGGGTDTLVGTFNQYLSDYKGSFVICHDNSGNNILNAGSGSNDFLVGDVRTRIMTLDGMHAEVQNGQLTSATYTCKCGNNQLTGGDGNGDVLIGDFETFSRVATNTVASPGLAHSLELAVTFGDSTITAGSGSSLMIGDVKNLTMGMDVNAHDVANFGKDTLISGSGNDTMVGDVMNLSLLTNNGNIDLFYAKDTFQFALNKYSGADSILDFNAGGVLDVLKFTGISNCSTGASAVDAQIKNMTNDGHGDLLINFKNGSSIDLTTVAYHGQAHILDVVDAAHLVVTA